jgi:hypothetical protein
VAAADSRGDGLPEALELTDEALDEVVWVVATVEVVAAEFVVGHALLEYVVVGHCVRLVGRKRDRRYTVHRCQSRALREDKSGRSPRLGYRPAVGYEEDRSTNAHQHQPQVEMRVAPTP